MSTAEYLSSGERDARQEQQFVGRLIQLVNSPFRAPDAHRRRAADLVALLASRDEEVSELLIATAKNYAREQHIDDAFPYSPNPFEILAAYGRGRISVIAFLRDVANDDYGVARQAAIDALQEVLEPAFE